MVLTKDFREMVCERIQSEPEFGRALFQEALELMCNGELDVGRAILRNYINATIGFPGLSRALKIPSPSLQRMFGPKGNPRADNLFGVIAHLQKQEGVSVSLKMKPV